MMHGARTRQRSPENILAEMELLVRNFNAGELQIIDDNFTGNKKRTIEICEAMTRRGLGVVWKTPNGIRVDMVDDELIAAMKRAGCYEVGLGIESASRTVLDLCGKKFDAPAIRNAIRIIRRNGLDVYGFFILGMPGETRDTLSETVNFMVSSGLDHVSISYCVPYPGSKIYDEFISPLPEHPAWERFIHFTPFPGLSELSDDELKRAMKKALLRFYIHPRRAIKLLAKIKSTPLSRTSRLLQKYLGKAK